MRKHYFVAVLSLFLGILPLVACAKIKRMAASMGRKEIPSTATGPELARAGTLTVQQSEFDDYLRTRRFDPSKINAAYRNYVIHQLLRDKMRLRLAHESGVEKDPRYQQQLKVVEDNVLVNAFQQRMSVTEEEAKAYFTLHTAQFQTTPPLLGHIRAKTVAQARKYQKLLRQGRAVPGWRSDPISAFVEPGKSDPAFFRALNALKPAQISDPIKRPYGFEIVKRPIISSPDYNALRQTIYAAVQAQKVSDLIEKSLAATSSPRNTPQ